jgi:hypothetical protein
MQNDISIAALRESIHMPDDFNPSDWITTGEAAELSGGAF